MTLVKKNVFVIVLLISMNTFTQEIVTDRPDQTESSVTVGKNNFQIESGLSFLNNSNNSGSSFFGPSALVRYGVSNGIELRFFAQHETTKIVLEGETRKFSGINDLEIGAKFQIFKKSHVNTEIAFLSHVILPTANDNVSINSFGTINKIAISHTISNKVGLGYNVGFDHVEKQSLLTYSLVIGIALSKNTGFYVESYGNLGESNNFESNFDTGFTYLVNNNFQLDVSYGVGLNNDMNYLSAGFSWKTTDFLVKNKL